MNPKEHLGSKSERSINFLESVYRKKPVIPQNEVIFGYKFPRQGACTRN